MTPSSAYGIIILRQRPKGLMFLKVNNWRFWLGLGVSAFFLIILVYSINLKEVTTALGEANYVYVVPAIGLYFIAVYFRSLRWQFLLSPISTLRVSEDDIGRAAKEPALVSGELPQTGRKSARRRL